MTAAITRCRSCGSDRLDEVLDLGNLAVSDFVTDPAAPVDRAPLALVLCANCTMAQLAHTSDRDRLYKTAYWYRSGVNETMVAELRDVVDEALRHVDLQPSDNVLDIGSNDGTLLDQYDLILGERRPRRIGVEPAPEMQRASMRKGHPTYCGYFPFPPSQIITPSKIITSIAQFYNVDDVNAYVAAIRDWLHPEGVWIVQFQDLGNMLRCNGVDNVCHEHVTYPSRQSMQHLLRRHGLDVDTWSERAINGGSLRLVVKHQDKARNLAGPLETDQGWRSALRVFAARTEANKYDVLAHLGARRARGERVYGYAASTKANTLLQYYGIGPDLVTAVAERSPEKWGRYTVGTNIPIVSEQDVRDAAPDALFVGAWQFADAFARREAALIKQGTRLIVPLPRLHVLGSERLAEAA